jgi:acyl-coenzyme A thioesterase PaaI-like protein
MSGNEMTGSAPVSWAASAERRELGESVRRLLAAVVRTGAGPAVLRAAAGAVDQLATTLDATTVAACQPATRDAYRNQMNLVGGYSHPVAPQLHMTVHEGSGTGEVVLGPVFEGGPGLVHGGIVALLIDHAMSCVAATADRPAMTVQLDVRYRRPTPLGVPLTVSASLDRIENRKLHLSGTISAAGSVTVEADGLFLALTGENLASVFTGVHEPPAQAAGCE